MRQEDSNTSQLFDIKRLLLIFLDKKNDIVVTEIYTGDMIYNTEVCFKIIQLQAGVWKGNNR